MIKNIVATIIVLLVNCALSAGIEEDTKGDTDYSTSSGRSSETQGLSLSSLRECLDLPPPISEEQHPLVEQETPATEQQSLLHVYEKVENSDQFPWSVHGLVKAVFGAYKTEEDEDEEDTSVEECVGTGILIRSNVVLTAAHNVYDKKRRVFAKSATFFSCFPKKAVSIAGNRWDIPFQYINSSSEESVKYDIALLFLEQSAGDHYISFKALTNEELETTIVRLTGYPSCIYHDGHIIVNKDRHLYTIAGKITSATAHHLFYNGIRTYGGQSGAGVCSVLTDQVYGIHTRRGFSATNSELEHFGTRINTDNFEWIKTKVEERNEKI